MSEEMGTTLRSIRKKKGLRIVDLAEKGLSTATISFIEQGKSVKPNKLARYCEKLGIQPSQFPGLIKGQYESNKQLKMDLFLLESKISLGLDDSSLLTELRMLEKKKVPLLDLVYFLKGKYYFDRKKWSQARKYFEKVVQLVQKQENYSSNLIAAAYKELARISFYEANNLKSALHYTSMGLEHYQPEGERLDIKYFLAIGKVSYLEKLNRIDEALFTLDDLWREFSNIHSLEIRLNMFETKASLLNRKKEFNQALPYVMEGYELACRNDKYRRAVELLTVWGNILTNLQEYRDAEQRYQLALEFKTKKKVQGNNLFVSTYTHLGLLYKELGETEKARCYLEKAVKAGKQSKDTQRYCLALMSLADFEASQKLFTNAVFYYEEAKSIAIEFHLDIHLENILVQLADCWKKSGRKDKYITALEEVQKLLLYKGGEEI